MTFPACGVIVEEEELANDRALRPASHSGGQARHVTILMPVADSTIVDPMTTFEDGATTDDLPEYPPGPSAVAIAGGRASVDAGVLEPASPALAGDTTEDTDEDGAANFDGTQLPHLALAVDNQAAVEVLPADLPGDDAAAEETGVVELGWGIVLPKLSVEDFKEILSFPKL